MDLPATSLSQIKPGIKLTFNNPDGRRQRLRVTSVDRLIGVESYLVSGILNDSHPITYRISMSHHGPIFTTMAGRKILGSELRTDINYDPRIPVISIVPITPSTDIDIDDEILGTVMFIPHIWNNINCKVRSIDSNGYIKGRDLSGIYLIIGFTVDQMGIVQLVYDRKIIPSKNLTRRRITNV